jgi:hypothetical protein
VKTIQINLGGIKAAEVQESFVEIHSATKIRILFFYPSIVGCSREEESRQSERFHLTLNVSGKHKRGQTKAPLIKCENQDGVGILIFFCSVHIRSNPQQVWVQSALSLLAVKVNWPGGPVVIPLRGLYRV